jgi:hypothetical protein
MPVRLAGVLGKPLIAEASVNGVRMAPEVSRKKAVPALRSPTKAELSEPPATHMSTLTDDDTIVTPRRGFFACFSCAVRPAKQPRHAQEGASARPAPASGERRWEGWGLHGRGSRSKAQPHMQVQNRKESNTCSGSSAASAQVPAVAEGLHWWQSRGVAAR